MVGRSSCIALATVLATACGEAFQLADNYDREHATSNTDTETDADGDTTTTSTGGEWINTVTSNAAMPRDPETNTGCLDGSTSTTR